MGKDKVQRLFPLLAFPDVSWRTNWAKRTKVRWTQAVPRTANYLQEQDFVPLKTGSIPLYSGYIFNYIFMLRLLWNIITWIFILGWVLHLKWTILCYFWRAQLLVSNMSYCYRQRNNRLRQCSLELRALVCLPWCQLTFFVVTVSFNIKRDQ